MNNTIEQVKHIIDLDADPFVSEGWEVVEHVKGGQFEWDPAKISRYLSDEQQGDKLIDGDKLREELKSQKVVNANLLDYLLAHQELIPEEWKNVFVFVFFWGTVYHNPAGDLLSRIYPNPAGDFCVRYLYWDGAIWWWNYFDLNYVLSSQYSAAIFKED